MDPEDLIVIGISLVAGFAIIPILIGLAKAFGAFAVVHERQEHVYTLFGKVLGTLDEPGLHIPVKRFGPRASLVPFFGRREIVSNALRQHYLRGQMVNSEEGTPMGVGIWYEMEVNDPVAYLFANTNPEGSLQANVASSTISTLSNLEMDKMLEDRHSLSRTVRQTVSPLSEKWGYRLGSVYIRKVFFTDEQMVQNITDKVVKRLVQVTSAMKQDGDNRVGLIRSETAKKVSQKMAEASAMRPQYVGSVLNEIAGEDEEILDVELEVMEVEKLLESQADINVIPRDANIMLNLGGNENRPSRSMKSLLEERQSRRDSS
ncbi:MAG: SPFH/Band 7/PHB domain protein [Pirellulaceae bacterium]|nr:SPFH/Band 7/PHB domain protein [Pirellulaceae bacterium]